jgi:type II secretory pathway pseudopilin PulG
MSTNKPTRAQKFASSIWAILIGIGIIALAGSILLPSTKRARVGVEELRRMSEERQAALAAEEAAAATQTSTVPSTASNPASTQP